MINPFLKYLLSYVLSKLQFSEVMDDFLGNYIKESFPVPIGQNIYKLTGSNARFLGRQSGS